MTINEFYNYSKSLLKSDFIENPDIESRLIISHILKISLKEFLLLRHDSEITKKQFNLTMKLINKRLKGESIAEIIGKKEFYGIDFFVNKDVLIPRPETELIIDIFLDKIKKEKKYKILDIGTGSAVLPIVLSDRYPDSTFYAIDKSESAIKVALKNVENLSKNRNIMLLKNDFFSYKPDFKFDVIISNPPYIPEKEVKRLLKEKIVSDPFIALNGGKDGLNFYRYLNNFAENYLECCGYIIIEHGFDQQNKIAEIFEHNYKIELFRDLSKNPRAIYMVKKD